MCDRNYPDYSSLSELVSKSDRWDTYVTGLQTHARQIAHWLRFRECRQSETTYYFCPSPLLKFSDRPNRIGGQQLKNRIELNINKRSQGSPEMLQLQL